MGTRRRWVAGLLVAVVGLGSPAPAGAWGPRGHRTVARLAQERLSPKALRAVRALLDEGDDLVDVANWADREAYDLPEFARSGPWHFVNVPLEAERYADRYCRRGDCVVAKIGEYRRVLADKTKPRRERLVALKFVVHLVADVHQPLHVGDNDDRGGNGTQVQFLGETGNFHRVWDSGLIEETRQNDRAWADRVRGRITPEGTRAWANDPVETWANESLATAKLAYRGPGRDGPSVTNGARLGRAYHEFALPIVEDRLARATVRLAHVLETALAEER